MHIHAYQCSNHCCYTHTNRFSPTFDFAFVRSRFAININLYTSVSAVLCWPPLCVCLETFCIAYAFSVRHSHQAATKPRTLTLSYIFTYTHFLQCTRANPPLLRVRIFFILKLILAVTLLRLRPSSTANCVWLMRLPPACAAPSALLPTVTSATYGSCLAAAFIRCLCSLFMRVDYL